MNLPLFLPHTLKDTSNLLRLLDWINELGGAKRNRAIVISELSVPQPVRDRVEKKAKTVFAGVTMTATAISTANDLYPIGPNWMFEKALREAVRMELPNFLYLHPDALPTRESWLADIEGMFARCGKPYMGQVAPGPNGVQTLGSIACFAMPAAKSLMRYTAGSKKQLWNTRAGAEIAALAHHTQLIVSNGKGLAGLHQLPKVCALYHADKNGNVMKMLKEAREVEAGAPAPEMASSTSEMLAQLAQEENA